MLLAISIKQVNKCYPALQYIQQMFFRHFNVVIKYYVELSSTYVSDVIIIKQIYILMHVCSFHRSARYPASYDITGHILIIGM